MTGLDITRAQVRAMVSGDHTLVQSVERGWVGCEAFVMRASTVERFHSMPPSWLDAIDRVLALAADLEPERPLDVGLRSGRGCVRFGDAWFASTPLALVQPDKTVVVRIEGEDPRLVAYVDRVPVLILASIGALR